MAKIMGSCGGSAASKYDLWLEVVQNSQNLSANKSNITATLKLKRNDGYASSAYNLNTDENSVALKVGNTTVVSKTLKIDTRNNVTVTLATWTGDVTHSSDGTLTISLSGSFSMSGTSLSGGSVSGNFTCTTIKRVSTLVLGASTVVPGGSFSIGISGDASLLHIVQCRVGDNPVQNTTFAPGTLSGNVTIPLEWASYLPNSTEATMHVWLLTYSGNTYLGFNYYSIKLVIPDSATFQPDFSLTLQRIDNGVPASYGVYVSGVSQLMAVASNVIYKYGASLRSISVKYDGNTLAKNNAVFNVRGSGVQEVVVRITDSRGYYKELKQEITVIPYSLPTVTINSIKRCNSDGTENSKGTYLKVDYSSSYTPVVGNGSTLTLRWYLNDSVLGTINPTSSPVIIGGGAITTTSSYDVILTISDTIKSVSVKRRIGTPPIPFNVKPGGNAVGIGCYAENDNELTVGFDLNLRGRLKCEDITDSLVINSDYVEKSSGKFVYYSCLGIVFFQLNLKAKVEIPSAQQLTLFTISGQVPVNTTIITAEINYIDKIESCRISADGVGAFAISNTSLPAGGLIWMSGFYFTD